MRGDGDAKQVVCKNGGREVCLGPLPSALPGTLWNVASAAALRRCLGATWARRGEKKVRLSLEPLGRCGAQERLDRVFPVSFVGWWSQGAGLEGLSRGQLESVGRGRSPCAARPAPTDGPVSLGTLVPALPLGLMQTPGISGHLQQAGRVL